MPLSSEPGRVLMELWEVEIGKAPHGAGEVDLHKEGTYFPKWEEVKTDLKVMYFLGMN